MRIAVALLGVVLVLPAPAQAQKSGVLAFVLPTRRADYTSLSRRLDGLAEGLAKKNGSIVVERVPLDLSARLSRAQGLYMKAAVDQAAPLFDAALEDGAHAPHRVLDARSFVAAHVTRASIALARGEDERAQELLLRLLRYDPSLTLQSDERSPPLEKAYAEAKKQLQATSALTAVLGEACNEAATILVARMAVSTVARFDDCKLTAETALVEDDAAVLAALQNGKPSAPASGDRSRPGKKRPWLWAVIGLTVAAVSSAVIAGAVVGTQSQETQLVPRYPR